MRIFIFALPLLFLGCTNNAGHNKPGVKTYDTLSNGQEIINNLDPTEHHYKNLVGTDSLSGNYQVFYAKADSSYYLYLKHGDSLSLLNKTSRYTSLHHLGTAVKDQVEYFILSHDNGNGSPASYEYIDKKTRKNPLGYGKEYADAAGMDSTIYLLYEDTVIERLTLFNTRTYEKEFFKLEDGYWELFIDTLTKRQLRIRYTINYNGDTSKTKTYKR